MTGDPHIRGAHGDTADFRGAHKGVYNLLSAKNFSVNIKVEDDNFTSPYSKLRVRGSWIRATFYAIRTARTGRQLQVFFHARDPRRAIITEGCTAPYCRDAPGGRRLELADGGPPLVIENVRMTLDRKNLRLGNGQWLTSAKSTRFYPHLRKLRMDVLIKATYQERRDPVAPHGLLGQTYDRDWVGLIGRLDDYSSLDSGERTESRTGVGGEVTTRAHAEGAIEGNASDYRMASDFATAFRFSRFDSIFALPRNASALGGKQVKFPTRRRSKRRRRSPRPAPRKKDRGTQSPHQR